MTGRVSWAGALALSLLIGTFPPFALGAFGPQLRDDLGLATADVGLLFAGLYTVAVFGSPLAGPLVDRLGGRRSCLLLLLLSVPALTAASLAGSRGALLLALVPCGAAMAFANPGTIRWATAAPTEDLRNTLVGVAQAGVQAGALAAGGLAAAHVVGLGWRDALRVTAVVAAAGLVVAWRAPDDRRLVSTGTARSAGVAEAALDVPTRRARSVQRALAGYAACMGAGTSVVIAYLPSFGVDAVGLSIGVAGATAALYGAVALVCRSVLGPVLRRTGGADHRALLVMSGGAIAAVLVVAAGAWSPPAVWIGTVLFGATGTTWPAVAFLLVAIHSPVADAGRTAAWVTAAFYTGMWLAPPLAGRLVATGGYPRAWGLVGLAYLAAVVPALRVRRQVRA
ncbi:MFS transporter [Egicoccus halophilus]|uniref:Major facilitator superfamily (MFS) profile domain-containing protein n=1 Tax=Egicoccus halophilus TaxID=1670830 RepID=A0A8J3AGK8_9ACTN|nr:MFS transporter [Egicoccus halophilus]GGI08977.1 hypothetical protein GCM10011354_31780 [Egicoccus halophilus]